MKSYNHDKVIWRTGQRIVLVSGKVALFLIASFVTFVALQGVIELKKRIEELRLLESRKSARLMDQDTDFARLADMAADRKRTSSNYIEVPIAG